jgi:hypothetical protein
MSWEQILIIVLSASVALLLILVGYLDILDALRDIARAIREKK